MTRNGQTAAWSPVGQVGNLRPIVNRPRAGPKILVRLGGQPCTYRVHLDVPGNPRKFPFVPNQTVIAIVLPEWISGQAQNPIALPRGKPLERLHQLRNRHARFDQDVNVVRHDHKTVKMIMLRISIANRFGY